MKVFFNLKPPNGSYGGGAFFVKNLSEFLITKNINITYKLNDNDIDIIIIIDPRKGKCKKYSINDIINYKNKNPNVKIIHRINECDIKREKSINIEPKILSTMEKADHIIFVSNWLKEYYFNKYKLNIQNVSSILNSCNQQIFYPLENKKINKIKIKLITHHWSDDYLKGFEIYNKLDKILETNKDFSFTFIGNYNKKYKPKNINLIKPITGIELSNILREHDIYLTATQFEPGGVHYVEGMLCGLPVLYYKNGGSVKETVNDCGLEFNDIEDLLKKIKIIANNYDNYKNKIDYNFLYSTRLGDKYYELINNI